MNRLKEWLFKAEDTIEGKLAVVAVVMVILVTSMYFMKQFIGYLHYDAPRVVLYGFYTVILAPLWEELAFRVIPVAIAEQLNPKLLWPIIGLSTIIFAFGHTDSPSPLLIQGVLGLGFMAVYLKTRSYLCSVLIHSLWNGFILYSMIQ